MSKKSSKLDRFGASAPLLQDDAVSLHTQNGDEINAAAASSSRPTRGRRGFLDDDDDDDDDDVHNAPEPFTDGNDMPPLYADVADDVDNADADDDDNDMDSSNQLILAHTASQGPRQTRRTCIAPVLDADAALLQANIDRWGHRPPRPFVRLRGTHTETTERRAADGKTSRETHQVVDFDVRVDLTPYLYKDALDGYRAAWRTQRLAENYERVRRGTVFRCRGPQYVRVDNNNNDLEASSASAASTEPTPDLAEWCRRYCDPAAPALRVFSLHRRMVGFDEAKVRTLLERLVRQTNYRGHLAVSFPTDEQAVDLYSNHPLNRWRQNKYIRFFFFITGLFLLAWPLLFFTTRRYEVVAFDWAFSRPARGPNGAPTPTNRTEYVTLSEDQWYNLWARAIQKAVLDKRHKILDQEDLRDAEGARPTFEATGNRTVDGALSFVQAGLNAMGQVNRHIGWGADSC